MGAAQPLGQMHSFLCPGDHVHSDREQQVTLRASSHEQPWQQGGRVGTLGLVPLLVCSWECGLTLSPLLVSP